MRKAFICPTKYVQGENEIENLGYFVKTFGNSALLIAHPDDSARVKDKLDRTAEKFGITFVQGDLRASAPEKKWHGCRSWQRKKAATVPSVWAAEKH